MGFSGIPGNRLVVLQSKTSPKGYPMQVRNLRNLHPLTSQALNLTLDTPNLSQALGLNWSADLTPVYVMDADANPRPVPGRMGLVRSDNGKPLSIVGSRFVPFQNEQTLDFFRKVADPDSVIVGSRSYNGGEHVTITARVPSLTASYGQDVTQGFLTISNRHGTGSLETSLWANRLVCSNGAKISIRMGETLASGRHTMGLTAKVDNLSDSYKLQIAMWAGATEQFRVMVQRPSYERSTKSAPSSLERITLASFGLTLEDLADETDRSRTIRENKQQTIRRIRRSDTCNVDGTAGTVYADLQAVTEFFNHERGDEDGESGMFGANADAMERAHAEAFAIATA